MNEVVRCYRAHGLRIRSALALPFDPLSDTEATEGTADVTVRFGPVPGTLPAGAGRLVRTDMWQARPGVFLMQMEGVARYLIADGRDVRIEPLGGGHADIASFLVGMWAVLLQQRGVATLHAAAVRTPAGAVLLLGRSGSGKSSLAAALVERGHALLADDVTGLMLRDGQVVALPSFASMRLWKQTLGQRSAHFRVAAAMARQAPMSQAWRPRHPFLLEELAARVEVCAADLGEVSAEGDRVARRFEPPAATPPASPAPARSAVRCGNKRDTPRTPGMVWIACWPKSGSTWLRTVLTNCLRDDGQPASINALVGAWLHGRDEFDDYLGFDSSHMTEAETSRHLARFRAVVAEELPAAPAAKPTFAKTHEVYRLPNGPPRFPRGGKVIHLMRNPLDVAVSYAHHLTRSIGDTIQLMDSWQTHEGLDRHGIHNRPPEPMTTWSNHALSWIEQGELPVHTARYEDLLADPRAGFGAIARFAGLDLDDERLDRAIEHSAFHRLRAQEAEAGFHEKQPTAPLFFRAGTAGSWRGELAPEQVRAVVDAHGHVMERFGYLREARGYLDAASARQPA